MRTYKTRYPTELTSAQRRLVRHTARAYARHRESGYANERYLHQYREAVLAARDARVPLQALADAIGISRQAVHRAHHQALETKTDELLAYIDEHGSGFNG